MKTTLLLMVLLLTGAAFAQLDLKPEASQAVAGAAELRHLMRDPDSFVVERVLYTNNHKDKDTYCYEYRSRNGFGGMNRSIAYFSVKHKSGDEKIERFHFPEDGLPYLQVKARNEGCAAVGATQDITNDLQAKK